MTRVFTDGAEFGDMLFIDTYGGVDTGLSATARTGSYSYQNSSIGGGYITKYTGSLSEGYLRFAYYSTHLNSEHRVPQAGAVSQMFDIRIPTDVIQLYVGGVYKASGTTTITNSVWHLFEIYFLISDTGQITVKVDGNTEIDWTGDTKPGSDTTITWVQWYKNCTCTFLIDDLALNSTAGGSDNSWCQDGRISKVYPNGNGTDNDWTGSDGDSVNNYLLVDEFPKDDETTYVTADGTSSGLQDQYALSDFDGSGGKIIHRIYPECRARKTDANPVTLKLGILPSGGADDLSDARTLTTTYARYVGDEYTTNPADAGAWEEADIDALEGIVEIG